MTVIEPGSSGVALTRLATVLHKHLLLEKSNKSIFEMIAFLGAIPNRA